MNNSKLRILVGCLLLAKGVFGQENIQNLFFNSTNNITRLDFSTDPPTAIPTNIVGTNESIAHYEDANGDLLFLVNANGVYDRNNTIMPNSTGITVNTDAAEINICPVPNQLNQYYILYNNATCSQLSYSIVDMSLNGGLGDLSMINQVLDSGEFSEGMEVIAIPNENAYWYLTYECAVGIKRFLIDENGIQTGQIIHNIPLPIGYDGRGEFDYHNGKLGIAFAFSKQVLAAEFDPVTGNICNPRMLEDDNFKFTGQAADPSPFGLEFSPDGSKMYFGLWYLNDAPFIYQYDFQTTLYTGHQPNLPIGSLGIGHIELGKDGKLYVIQLATENILVLENPNDDNPIFSNLPIQFPTTLGISDHIQSTVLDNYTLISNELCVSLGEEFTLFPTDETLTYEWFLEGETLLMVGNTFTNTMLENTVKFVAQSINNVNCVTTIEEFTLHPTPSIDAGNDFTMVLGESANLAASINLDNLTTIWFPNDYLDNSLSLTPTITPTTTGTFTYIISASTTTCQAVDTLIVQVINEPIVPLNVLYDTLCVVEQQNFVLSADSLVNIQWTTLEDTSHILSTGVEFEGTLQTTSITYLLKGDYPTIDGKVRKTITLFSIPAVNAGNDQTLTAGESVLLNATNGGGSGYNWQPTTGLDNPTIASPMASPTITTTYYVTSFYHNNCLGIDSVTLTVKESEPNDSIIVTPPSESKETIVLPTAFTPNEDGVNDKLKLITKDIASLQSFQIFNRWGQLVFETTDLQGYWDGFYRSRPQETGIYVYQIIGINKENETIQQQGHVLLIR